MITDPIPEILQTRSTLEDKIKALSAAAEHLPVVIIVHDLRSQGVIYMSPNGLQILGFSLEKIKELGPAYHEIFFNKEDQADYAPRIFSLLDNADIDKIVSVFQQVRPSQEHDWKWYLTAMKPAHPHI
jgi:PAS domain-containing protein